MANVNKNRRRKKFQDRALFGYLEQNRRMEASVAQFFRSPCGGFVLGNQKVPYLETCNGETPVFSTTWGSLGHLLKQYQFWISVTNPVIFAWFCLKYYRSRWFCWKKLIFIQIWGITKHAARGSETSTIAETLSYTGKNSGPRQHWLRRYCSLKFGVVYSFSPLLVPWLLFFSLRFHFVSSQPLNDVQIQLNLLDLLRISLSPMTFTWFLSQPKPVKAWQPNCQQLSL